MISIASELVWIASYPKSGNTWMRILLANLMAREPVPININAIGRSGSFVIRQIFEDEAIVDTTLLCQSELDRLRPVVHDFVGRDPRGARFIKTHDQGVRQDGFAVLGSTRQPAIYLLRDPRDVAVSYAHHMDLTQDKAIADMAKADNILGAGPVLPHLVGDWSSHVVSWVEQDRIPVLVLRYEDLLADTLGELTRVVAFLGIDCDADALERTVEHSRFDALQRQEAQFGFVERQPGQARFFRSGRVGAWREALTPVQVREIEAAHGAVMQRWGYELSWAEALAG